MFARGVIATQVEELDLAALAPGEHRLRLALGEDGTSACVRIPVHVLKGRQPGPVVGITAAIHGNEVNGIPTIHRLYRRLNAETLKGTVVAAAPVNLPGFLRNQREFSDGKDLNRLFPGKPDGYEGQVYAHAVIQRLVRHFECLLDLHTASFGRINSLYIRADMTRTQTAELARVIRPQSIVHNRSGDGTLRGAAEDRERGSRPWACTHSGVRTLLKLATGSGATVVRIRSGCLS
jgi:predicted deacylase